MTEDSNGPYLYCAGESFSPPVYSRLQSSVNKRHKSPSRRRMVGPLLSKSLRQHGFLVPCAANGDSHLVPDQGKCNQDARYRDWQHRCDHVRPIALIAQCRHIRDHDHDQPSAGRVEQVPIRSSSNEAMSLSYFQLELENRLVKNINETRSILYVSHT